MKCTGYVPLVKLLKSHPSLKVYVAVGIGGLIGSIIRYIVSILFFMGDLSIFPWATLIVNVTGSFLLTFILFSPFIKNRVSQTTLTALTTGVIGSYTTFSAIIVEVVPLWSDSILIVFIYLALTIIGGLLCSFAGIKTAEYVDKKGA